MRYLYLMLALFCGTTLFAQLESSVTFTIANLEADSGDRICLPVSIKDFTGVKEFSFALKWEIPQDGGVLTFSSIENLNPNLPFFTLANFNTIDYVSLGLITLEWGNYPAGGTCSDASLQTVDDGLLFEICFDVAPSAPIGSNHTVRFFDKPNDAPPGEPDNSVEISVIKSICGTETINERGIVPGSVTIGVSPVILSIPEVTGEFLPGDTYCIDVNIVSGFNQIKGFQYGVFFDPTVLRATSVSANTSLSGHDNNDYNLFPAIGAGGESVYATWTPFPDIPLGLADGTRLVTICFEVIGECNSATDIRIGEGVTPDNTDRPIDFNGDGLALSSVPVVTTGIQLRVDNCNPAGFDVIISCPTEPVNFGDTEVCVDILAGDDFVNMVEMRYLLSFDPEVLEFARIGNRAGSLFINPTSDYDYDGIDDGLLIFDWDSPNGPSLAEGTLVFQVCFNAIGFGGTSPIVASRFRSDPRSSSAGFFTGINPDNCAITVQQPEGVAVTFPDLGYSSTQDVCFPLEVTGFTNVTEMTFFVVLPAGLLEFVSFTPAVSGVTATAISAGLVQISYTGAPFTIPADGSLGTFCFRARANAAPGDCSGVLTTLDGQRVVTTESEGNPVNFETFDGEVCVLFPNGFGLIVGDTESFINEQVCVPVSVTRFQDILNFSTTFNFDPTRLTFRAVNLAGSPLTGVTPADFDFTNVAAGRLTLNWASSSPAGLDLAMTDTVQIFEICFDAGSNDECTEVEARDAATPPVNTTEGEGSIIYGDGEVCLNDQLILLNLEVIPATCADSDDGQIIYTLAPRPNGEDIFIRVEGPGGRIRRGSLGSVTGLLPGANSYLLFNSGSSVRLEGTIEVTSDPANAAVALFDENPAGPPQLSCGDAPLAVIGGRNNVGETWRLFVITPAGTTRLVDDGDVPPDGNIVALVRESGDFILQVTSAAGCSARDTITVLPAARPIAVAGDNTSLTCNGSGVELSGAGSSTDNNARYLWQRVATDGTVLEDVGTTININVTLPGRYRLTVTFPVLQCAETDEVIVSDDNALPQSDLPTSAALNCDGGPVTLSVGPPEADVTYTWTEAGSPTVLSTTTTYATADIGAYVVDMVNERTGCSRSDTVIVMASTGAPVINTTEVSITMPCNPDTLVLDETIVNFRNVNQDTRYRWSTVDGRVVISDATLPNPRIVLPGDYKVVVTAGACTDSTIVSVKPPVFPEAKAGDEVRLECNNSLQLTGSGTSTTDMDFAYQWSLADADVPMGAAATVVVNQPGLYFLEVTGIPSGCTALDSVLVRPPNGFPGFSLVDTVGGLGCAPATVTFQLEGAGADDYQVVWTDPSGTEISTAYSVTTGVVGLHRVMVTNPATGCMRQDSVLVEADAAGVPIVAFRRNSLELSCEDGPVWLDGAPSSQGDIFDYRWETIEGDEQPGMQGNDSLRIRTAGIYRLTVINTETNCTNSRDVIVTDPRVFPEVTAVPGAVLDCDNRETTIGINIADQPNDFTIQWAGPAGVVGLPRDTNRIAVTNGGTYNAIVINPTTSCVTTIAIRVEDLIDSIATIAIMTPDSFDCNNTTITIDASGTDLNGTAQENISWTSFDGNAINPPTGSLIVSVNGPGDYELAITDGSGCTIRDTVRVEAALDTPFAQAGADQEIECGDMPQLDGSASTPAPTAGILYEWTVIGGNGSIIGAADIATPFVSGEGVYQLVVSNLNNGCADTATTTVTLSAAVAADAGTDFSTCDPTATLTGNLPAGTTGVWTAFNDEGSVWTASGTTVIVSEVGDGLSLVWTLSAGEGCENYSADTVRVSPEDSPVANNDVLEVGGTRTTGMIDLLQNDQRTGPVTVTLLGEPSFGEILSNLNGTITFEAPTGLTDQTVIEYEVCSNACPDLCSRATLTIFSEAAGTDPTVYNAISPNGDGMNDVFYFEKLGRNPDEFPDNEMIIFNRWGDIIFDAKPYTNDWDGTSNGGALVPEGTYYYILRLNVGEGEIIKGDVTVIR